MSSADRDLLQDYLDGSLTAEQERALEDRLRRDSALAEAMVVLSREEAILTEWARSEMALQSPDAGIPVAIPFAEPVRHGPSRLRRRAIGLAVSGAAAAAVLIAVLMRGSIKTDAPAGMAKLEEIQGEVFVVSDGGDSVPAQSGQALQPGQQLRTQGEGSFAIVAFPDTSRLELGADTTIRLSKKERPGRKVILEQGIVAAEVVRQDDEWPMILTTPHAVARLGETRSSFASAGGETRIESEKGRVQLTRKSDGRSIDVPVGYYAIAAMGNGAFTPREMPRQVTAARLVLPESSGPVQAAAFSPDSATLAIGCNDGTIKLYDAASGTLKHTLPGHKKPIKVLAFAPVGHLLASGADDRAVKFWDPVTATELAPLKGIKGIIDALAFSPNGTLLLTGGGTGKQAAQAELRLWNVATRGELPLPKDTGSGITAVAFSGDGKLMATAGRDCIIKVWDTTTYEVKLTLTGHTNRINALAFAPRARLLVSGSKDRTVKVWDPTTGKEPFTIPAQNCDVRSVAFSPDGRFIAAADNHTTLWDAATGRERTTFKGHKHAIGAVRFSPNGKLLATTGWDRTVRVWDVVGEEAKMPRQ